MHLRVVTLGNLRAMLNYILGKVVLLA